VIKIYVDGRGFGKAGVGFSIFLCCGKHEWKRSFNGGNITSNQAEMKAVEYAIKSIKPEFANEDIMIKSSGRYVQMMLERNQGKWVKEPRTNIELTKEIRSLVERFGKFSIESCDDNIMQDLKKLTEAAVKKGREVFEKR
jgi:ribonuclease HI